MSRIRNVLQRKGSTAIWCVRPDEPVRAALALMADRNIGAVMVMKGDQLVGVFSERDLARKILRETALDLETPVSRYMTGQVYFAKPDDTVDECMKLMIGKHIRHLPVMSEGRVVGVISINDLVRATIADREADIRSLENFIAGSSQAS